jgi:catechol 2,3-dioxygenase
VELYWDRERSEWSWTRGRVEMATLMLDPNAFLREFKTDDRPAAASPASVGHVHLSVGDVATARESYVKRLGFETTAQVGSSALFVSAGGYHHHMAMNSWNSAGAGKRRLALGLGLVRIEVPTDDDLHSLGDRLRRYGLDGRNDGRVLGFDDPWLNRIEVTSKAGG